VRIVVKLSVHCERDGPSRRRMREVNRLVKAETERRRRARSTLAEPWVEPPWVRPFVESVKDEMRRAVEAA
jgi:hypothetical protein